MNRLRAVPTLEEEEAAKRHDQPRVSEIDRVREREHDALVVPPVHLIVHDPQHHAAGDGTQPGCCNPGDQRSIDGPSAERGRSTDEEPEPPGTVKTYEPVGGA